MLTSTEAISTKLRSCTNWLRKIIKKVCLHSMIGIETSFPFSPSPSLSLPMHPSSAVELQPGDALSLQYHGEVLSMLGRKAEARQQFMEAQISLAS